MTNLSGPVRVLGAFQGAPGGIGRVEVLLDRAWKALAEQGRVQATTIRKSAHPEYLAAASGAGYWVGNGSRLRFVTRCMERLIAEKPRLVVLSHINFAPMALFMKALRPKIRVAIMIYGIDAWRPLSFFHRKAVREADYIWSISEYTRNQLMELAGVPKNRVFLLPLCLPPEQACLTSDGAILNGNGPTLLTVSRLDADERSKGIAHVLEALPRILLTNPDVTYTIVGDGISRGELEQLAVELRVSHAVNFMGSLSDADLRRAYRECDFFVLPSNQEGFGLVSLEAMAAAKPVIAAAAGATPEVVLDGETGLLVPFGDADRLDNAISRLLNDRTFRQRLGQQARTRVIEHFGFETFVSRLAALVDVACR